MGGQRPKGYAPWNPTPEVQVTLDAVQQILVEYRNYLPLTNRQIFYRLVGAFGFEKTETAYKRLCNYLTRARRAQIIKFGVIRDDKVASKMNTGWDGLQDFQEGIRESADSYTLDRQQEQESVIEIWCEAEGMLPQMDRIAEDYSINCFSASGFLSVTATHDVAVRVAQRWKDEERKTVILHVGDYDPSGESIFDTIAADSGKFAVQYTRQFGLMLPVRVALTEEQIEEHDIPTVPPKSSDSRSARWIGQTAQAEAMPPDVLAEVVRDAVEEHIDMDIRNDILLREEQERERLQTWLEDLT